MKTTNKILLTLFVLILIGITAGLIYIRTQVSHYLEEQPESEHIFNETRYIETFQAKDFSTSGGATVRSF